LISIVIVSWNAAPVLRACLESIAAQTAVDPLEVIVVDNGSTDDTVALLYQLKPSVSFALTIIANQQNLGYGAANNQGAALAAGDVLVLLNPDTEFVAPTTLRDLCAELADRTIGLVGPRLVYPDGRFQVSCQMLPSVTGSILMGCGIHRVLSDEHRRRYTPETWSHNAMSDTGWLRGACMALPLRVFRLVGGFSSATFMYGEDLELAYYVHRAGYRVVYAPGAEVIHHDDYSADQRWSSPERATRVAYGELTFLRRNYPIHRRVLIRLVTLVALAGRVIILFPLNRPRSKIYSAIARVYISPWRGARSTSN